MKTLLFVILTFLSVGLYAQKDIGKVEWLSGTWTRTNAKPGRSGVEVWNKKNTELVGRGITLKGTDTTFIEKLKIAAKDGKLFYVADVPGNDEPTWFEFTELTDKSFVCENPQHDFPKKISYTLNGDDLIATISGDGRSVDYIFKRKK
jgi:hypothetical protein